MDFSLKSAWLLDAFGSDTQAQSRKRMRGTKMKNLILSDELRPKGLVQKTLPPGSIPASLTSLSAQIVNSPSKKTHQRSHSDASGLLQSIRRNHSSKIFSTDLK